MHPLAHHTGEQALTPLLLLLGSGAVPLLITIARARLAAARARLTRPCAGPSGGRITAGGSGDHVTFLVGPERRG